MGASQENPAPVVAAGAVVLRRNAGVPEVLLVHRPKYDDWSFPKGKLEQGESVRSAAAREVAEETGALIRLGPPLAAQTYSFGKGTWRTKVVHYWVGQLQEDHDPDRYRPNEEVDEVCWVPLDRARRTMSYDRDKIVLDEARLYDRKTQPLVVLRHAQARSRKRWSGDDRERTLTKKGEVQAAQLPPTLAAYGLSRLVSSSSTRCSSTLAPYADAYDLKIEVTEDLSEEDATPGLVKEEVEWMLGLREPVVVCAHRPVMPLIYGALGLENRPMQPASMLIVHHRKGSTVALERIEAPPGR